MTSEQTAVNHHAGYGAAHHDLLLAEAVASALRDHRRRLGLSQRAYAAVRRRARSVIALQESSAGSLCLDDVVTALEGTGFCLALVQCPVGAERSLSVRLVEQAA